MTRADVFGGRRNKSDKMSSKLFGKLEGSSVKKKVRDLVKPVFRGSAGNVGLGVKEKEHFSGEEKGSDAGMTQDAGLLKLELVGRQDASGEICYPIERVTPEIPRAEKGSVESYVLEGSIDRTSDLTQEVSNKAPEREYGLEPIRFSPSTDMEEFSLLEGASVANHANAMMEDDGTSSPRTSETSEILTDGKRVLSQDSKEDLAVDVSKYATFESHFKDYESAKEDRLDEQAFRGVVRYCFTETEEKEESKEEDKLSVKSDLHFETEADGGQALQNHSSSKNYSLGRKRGHSHIFENRSRSFDFFNDFHQRISQLLEYDYEEEKENQVSLSRNNSKAYSYVPFVEMFVADEITHSTIPNRRLQKPRVMESEKYSTLALSVFESPDAYDELSTARDFSFWGRENNLYSSPVLAPTSWGADKNEQEVHANEANSYREKLMIPKLFKRKDGSENLSERRPSAASTISTKSKALLSRSQLILLAKSSDKSEYCEFGSRGEKSNSSASTNSDRNSDRTSRLSLVSLKEKSMRKTSSAKKAVLGGLNLISDDRGMTFMSPEFFSAQRTVIVLGKVLERMNCVVLVQDDHHHVKVDLVQDEFTLSGMFDVEKPSPGSRVQVSFQIDRKQRKLLRRDRQLSFLYRNFFEDVAYDFQVVVDMYQSLQSY